MAKPLRCWLGMHTWGDWAFETPGSCTRVSFCRNCRQKRKQYVHEWGEWRHRKDRYMRLCNNCGAVETSWSSEPRKE